MSLSIDQFNFDQKGFFVELKQTAVVARLNKPEIRNPLSTDVINGLSTLMDHIATIPTSKVIFTGSGDSFASGANLREIEQLTPKNAREFAMRGQSLMTKIDGSPALTVASINGYCFGGGLDLALACKIRIASPKALFCHPGVDLGIITGWGGTQRLPRLVGVSEALEMLLTGSRLSAQDALRIGLIDTIVDDVLAAALDLAADSV